MDFQIDIILCFIAAGVTPDTVICLRDILGYDIQSISGCLLSGIRLDHETENEIHYEDQHRDPEQPHLKSM